MRSNSTRHLIAAASAIVLAACSNATSPDRLPLSVSLSTLSSTTTGAVLSTDIGGLRLEVPVARSKDIRPPFLGEVPVRAALVSATGDTLATVAFVHHFVRDSQHWIAGIVATRRPLGICVGTQVAAPVRGTATDSLFVAYGNLPNGSIC